MLSSHYSALFGTKAYIVKTSWILLALPAAVMALLVCGPYASASTGSAACAACHQTIYESYQLTPMAASSGSTGSGLLPERFDHAAFDNAPTGFRYRIYRSRGAYFVEFMKPDGTLRGAKALPYFVGSGSTARSYLLAGDG